MPLKVGQAMVDAVNNRGGHAKLTVYPDAGHFINDVTYENEQLYHWLLAQRRSRPQPHSPAAGKDTPRAPLPSSKK